MNNLKEFANYYYEMGFNISCITNYDTPHNIKEGKRYKRPYHPHEHLYSERQSLEELNSYDWNNATGLGLFTGREFEEKGWVLVAIDIDGVGFQELMKILDFLNLPRNYEWVVKTGSGIGYHIYFVTDFNNYFVTSDWNVAFPNNNFSTTPYFNKIEILRKAHLILPPSLHSSTFKYEFLNCTLPVNRPERLPHHTDYHPLHNLIHYFTTSVSVLGSDTLYLGSPFEWGHDFSLYGSKPNRNETIIKDVFVDIETDGLIEQGFIPSILQIAWYCTDEKNHIVKRQSLSIKQTIHNNKAFEINRLSIETLNNVGYELRDVLRYLSFDVNNCEKVICYNTYFDISIINHYYKQLNFDFTIQDEKSFCVMKQYAEEKNIPYLSLDILYNQLFKTRREYISVRGHNAELDVYKLYQIYNKLYCSDIDNG